MHWEKTMNAKKDIEQPVTALFLDCPIITTERLILRPPHKDDAEEMAILANNLNVARMLGTMPHPYSRADAENFIKKAGLSKGRACVYAITEADSGRLIGVGGLHEDHARYEQPYMGYWIGEPYWGKGYATEASRAMVDLFFKVTTRPVLLVTARADNEASKTIIRKCGGKFMTKSIGHHPLLNEKQELEHFHITRESWMGQIAA